MLFFFLLFSSYFFFLQRYVEERILKCSVLLTLTWFTIASSVFTVSGDDQKCRVCDERGLGKQTRGHSFLSQTPLDACALFRMFPLTESLERVRFSSAYRRYYCSINCPRNIGNLHETDTSMLRLESRSLGFSSSREILETRLYFTDSSLGPSDIHTTFTKTDTSTIRTLRPGQSQLSSILLEDSMAEWLGHRTSSRKSQFQVPL